jgi:hypothetical protein
MGKRKMTTADLLTAQAALYDAREHSTAERNAHRDRNRILRGMTRAQRLRATIIAAGVLHLCG